MTEQLASNAEDPSHEELSMAADVIARLPKNGLWPKELFYAVAERVVMPIVEIVPLRRVDNSTEVLLLKRPDDDPNWPGQLHTPGTVLRTTDLDGGGMQSAFDRIAQDELHMSLPTEPQLVGYDFHPVDRGPEMATVFSLDLSGVEDVTGAWYGAEALPQNVVGTQREFIARAVQSFEGRS